jgi:hypothetical protein
MDGKERKNIGQLFLNFYPDVKDLHGRKKSDLSIHKHKFDLSSHNTVILVQLFFFTSVLFLLGLALRGQELDIRRS